MTAYVHIGTEKTGTTSIQEFLCINQEKLKTQNIIYVSLVGSQKEEKF